MRKLIEEIMVNESPMEIFIFEPEGDGPHPALMQCMHIPVGHTGIENDEFTLKTAERYCDQGFIVAIPFIFHWWPKNEGIEIKREEFRDDWTKLDLDAAFKMLTERKNVDKERIGIFGHCWGGRVSWLGAATNPNYKACAIFYGGRILGIMGEGNPAAIELAANINCPVIGFFGDQDENPSINDVEIISQTLSNANVQHQFHKYENTGHAFQCFTMENRYHEEASEDAWEKVIEFFKEM